MRDRLHIESQRADRLEALRAEFVRRFSPAFVEQVERELLMPPGHAMPPGPASSGGAQAPLSPRRPSVATGTPGRIYAMTAKPGVMPLRRKSVR